MKNEARCVISWMYSCCYRSVLQKIQCVCVHVCVCCLFTDIFLNYCDQICVGEKKVVQIRSELVKEHDHNG